MTIDEAKTVFLNRGYVEVEGGTIYDADKWREACVAISEWLEQEPKTGHWIKTISENGITSAVRCSECGFEDNRYMLFRYCPDCGAKMEVEQNG